MGLLLRCVAVTYLLLCLLSLVVLVASIMCRSHVPAFALEKGGVSLYDDPSPLLILMTGYDHTWIVESPAGYVFTHRYSLAYRLCRKWGFNYSMEVCASALWAAQIVRDLPRSRFTLTTLAAYKACPVIAFFSMPILYLIYAVELNLPYEHKCAILYYDIAHYYPYVRQFPEWRHVSPSDWIRLCKMFRNYTLEPWDNYEGDIVVGATMLMLFPWLSELLPA